MKNTAKNTGKTETPQNYEAPALESVEVTVENGFGASGPPEESPVAPTSPNPSGPWK